MAALVVRLIELFWFTTHRYEPQPGRAPRTTYTTLGEFVCSSALNRDR